MGARDYYFVHNDSPCIAFEISLLSQRMNDVATRITNKINVSHIEFVLMIPIEVPIYLACHFDSNNNTSSYVTYSPWTFHCEERHARNWNFYSKLCMLPIYGATDHAVYLTQGSS